MWWLICLLFGNITWLMKVEHDAKIERMDILGYFENKYEK